MGAQIKVTGAEVLIRQLHTAHARIGAATAKHIYEEEVLPLAHAIQRAGSRLPGPARLAARTVVAQRLPHGGRVVAGVGLGPGAKVFFGAEFGGRRRPKVAYVSRSRKGRAYTVNRRTTQQFAAFLGHRGYFFFPTTRTYLRGLRTRIRKVAVKAVKL